MTASAELTKKPSRRRPEVLVLQTLDKLSSVGLRAMAAALHEQLANPPSTWTSASRTASACSSTGRSTGVRTAAGKSHPRPLAGRLHSSGSLRGDLTGSSIRPLAISLGAVPTGAGTSWICIAPQPDLSLGVFSVGGGSQALTRCCPAQKIVWFLARWSSIGTWLGG